MSDKKIYDTLEFDDDINFDGLDEYEEDYVDNCPDEVSAVDSVISETESFDEEKDNYSSDMAVEETICSDPIFNTNGKESYRVESTDKVEYNIPIHTAEDSVSESELKFSIKSQKSIKLFCAINSVISVLSFCILVLGIYCGYKYISQIKIELEDKTAMVAELKSENDELEAEYMEAMSVFEKESEKENEVPLIETEQGKIIHYDTYVGYSWMPVLSDVKLNTYKKDNFSVDDRYRMSYTEDGEESSYFGIDVSSYQGDIDWQLVKEDGVEFAFLRIGYRGYGEEGKLCADEYFIQNYEAARDVGIDLGIYFFSQATTVDEAVEEAEFVLSLLENRQLEYPIVFDWETVVTGDPEDIPRTEDVMPQTLTLSAIAFCETVKDAGYDAMIYTNKKLATIKYDLRQLSAYPVWLAYYDTELNYCYDFDIWQYGTGQVDGIEGEVDVNIAMIR